MDTMPNLKPSAVGPESCQLDGDGVKTCSTCKAEKPRSEFHRKADAKDGLPPHCKECKRGRDAAYRARNIERLRAYDIARYQHPARKAASNASAKRVYEKDKPAALKKMAEYARAHPEAVRKAKNAYTARNPAKTLAKVRRRQARKLNATPAWANQFFIEEIYELARMRTQQKTGGITEWQVDHIVPLQHPLVQGLHVEYNLQVIPALQNQRKGNRSWPDMPDRIVDSKGESIRGAHF